MKCQNCGKRDATVHLTEIKDKKKVEMHLCDQCAEEKGITHKQHFANISELLQTLGATDASRKKPKVPSVKCPNCGTMNYAIRWYCENCEATLASL